MQRNVNSRLRRSYARGDRNNEVFVEIIVKNLDKLYDTEEKVKQLFQTFGTISAIKLLKNSDGLPIGIAFVTFTQPYMAANACRSLNGKTNSFGKKIEVKKAITDKERMKDRENKETIGFWKVMIDNLDKEMDDKSLFQKFFIFGTILSHHVFRDEKGHSLGYGFIVFMTEEAANRAINSYHDIESKSLNLKVEMFDNKIMSYRKELFRRMLVIEGSNDCHSLKKLFQVYGSIETIETIGNKALLTFKDQSAVRRALSHSPYFQSIQISIGHKGFVDEFLCRICAKKKNIDNLLGFGCGDQFCRDCVRKSIEMSINDRTIDQKCPQYGCTELADQNLIRLVVSEQMFDKYKEMMKRKLQRERNIKFRKQNNLSINCIDENFKRCPNCLVPIELMEGCDHVKCLECSHNFCWTCLNALQRNRYGEVQCFNCCPQNLSE